ncbi:hypothetical protein M0802_005276 [Mischocyttarus mexicanus]|nr:hypothetical protein M0802_005276 [Mischocyttarus mexicanus]
MSSCYWFLMLGMISASVRKNTNEDDKDDTTSSSSSSITMTIIQNGKSDIQLSKNKLVWFRKVSQQTAGDILSIALENAANEEEEKEE